MKKIKVSELTGAALDWAVAKAIGLVDANRVVVDFKYMSGEDPVRWEPELSTYYSSAYSPTTDWAIGGPIVEQEKICLWSEGYDWEAKIQIGVGEWVETWGPTPLVAAMRRYVASKLGDEVEIPKELE